MVNENIILILGVVMEVFKFLYKNIGDLLILDVGGVIIDVYFVIDGSDYINKILVNFEFIVKRSVEGDLGVYVNMKNIVEVIGKENL